MKKSQLSKPRFGWLKEHDREIWHISYSPEKYIPCCCGLMIGGTPIIFRDENIGNHLSICGDCIYAILTERNNALY